MIDLSNTAVDIRVGNIQDPSLWVFRPLSGSLSKIGQTANSRPVLSMALLDKTQQWGGSRPLPSILGQFKTYWQPVWNHRRFVTYSWALTAWLVSTLSACTKISEPSLPDSLPLVVAAIALVAYHYLPAEKIARRLSSKWYVILWMLFVFSGLWAGHHLWWQSLLALLSVPILSQWFNELLQQSEGQTSLLATIWAFACLLERTLDLNMVKRWQFTHHLFLSVLTSIILALLSIFWTWRSLPPSHKPETIFTSTRKIPFAVVGVILVVTQAFLAELTRVSSVDLSYLYPLGAVPILAVLVMLPIASEFADAIMLYLSIVLTGVAIMLLEARSALWLGFPFFRLARDFVIFWWAQALVRFRQPHQALIPLVVSASILLAVLGREIGVWWLDSFQKFPIEEWSGILLFLVVPSTIPFVFNKEEKQTPSQSAKDIQATTTEHVVHRDSAEDVARWARSLGIHLTNQELRICEALLLGKSHAQIAAELYISPNTLKTHLRNIYHKTSVKNRFELVSLMAQGKILSDSHLSQT